MYFAPKEITNLNQRAPKLGDSLRKRWVTEILERAWEQAPPVKRNEWKKGLTETSTEIWVSVRKRWGGGKDRSYSPDWKWDRRPRILQKSKGIQMNQHFGHGWNRTHYLLDSSSCGRQVQSATPGFLAHGICRGLGAWLSFTYTTDVFVFYLYFF